MKGFAHSTLILLVLILLIQPSIYGQNETNFWYFGSKAGLDFNPSGPPIPLTNSAMQTVEGSTTVSDSAGTLLFYSDGETIWDASHNIMTNGTGLLGHNSSHQSSVAFKAPCSDSLYYIFCAPNGWTSDSMCYSIIDMSLNGGLGAVITKNVMLFNTCRENIAAVHHANGRDVWVASIQKNTADLYAYLVTPNGVSGPVISPMVNFSVTNVANSSLKFSPDGKWVTHGRIMQSSNNIHKQLNQFDNTTGVATQFLTLSAKNGIYGNNFVGISFSANSEKLYYCYAPIGGSYKIIDQYNMTAGGGTAASINASRTTVATCSYQGYETLSYLQLGNDNKIYVAGRDAGSVNWNYLSFITNVDQAPSMVEWAEDSLYLTSGKYHRFSLPNFVESYFDNKGTYNFQAAYNMCSGFNVSPNDTICEGDSTTLWAAGAGPFNWVDSSNFSTVLSTKDTLKVYPQTTTTYAVYNLVDTLYLQIVVNPLPTISAAAINGPIWTGTKYQACEGDWITLSGCCNLSYSWDNGVIDGEPFIQPVGTTTYNVIGTDTNQCKNTFQLNLTIDPLGSSIDTVIICQGDSIFLEGAYQTTAGIYKDTILGSMLSLPGGGGFWICDSTITTTLIVNSTPISTSLDNICQGDSIFFGGQWINKSGIYYDTIQNGSVNGCDSIVEISLSVFPNSNASILSDSVFCEDSPPINLEATTSGGTWTGVGITNTNSGAFDPSIAMAGTHLITYAIQDICGDTGVVNITVNENPSISSSYQNDNCDLSIGTINLDITDGNSPYFLLWSNGDDTEDLTELISGTYAVTVTDYLGCTESETFIIENILDCSGELWLPNIFSTNDDGLNDILYVRGTEKATTFLFTIYNRWGEIVFKTTNTLEGWDGTHHGNLVNNDVFAYIVSATFTDGSEDNINGTVTLVK